MTRREPPEAWTIATAVVWPALVVILAVDVPVLRPWWWLAGASIPAMVGAPIAVVGVLGWRAERRLARLQAHPRGAAPGVCRICGQHDPDWVDWGAHPSCREWLEGRS